jgi:hypothetical protein
MPMPPGYTKVFGFAPTWCTIPSKSERTSFRRCVRICFLSAVYEYEIERALQREISRCKAFAVSESILYLRKAGSVQKMIITPLHHEGGSASGRVPYTQDRSVQGGNLTGNGQAKAEMRFVGPTAVSSGKPIKDTVFFCVGDPGAVIHYCDVQTTGRRQLRKNFHGSASRGILKCVV